MSDELSTGLSLALPEEVLLKDRRSWPPWYNQLLWQSRMRSVWHLIDPKAEDAINPLEQRKEGPRIEDMRLALQKQRMETYERANTAWEALGKPAADKPPNPVPATLADVEKEYNIRFKEHTDRVAYYNALSNQYQAVWKWVHHTVDKTILHDVTTSLLASSTYTLQALVRALQQELAPSEMSTYTTAREEYRAVLKRAKQGGVSHATWYAEWNKAYQTAKAYKVSDVEGVMATKDFLEALSYKLAPDWARAELAKLIRASELGETPQSLQEYGRWFSALVHENNLRQVGKNPGIFATLGGRSDNQGAGANSGQSSGELNDCPCREEGGHKWQPQNCGLLEYVLTGKTNAYIRKPVTDSKCEKIKRRLKEKKWKALRSKLREKGWLEENEDATQKKSSSGGKFPGAVNAAVIDPTLMENIQQVYATLRGTKHPLSKSTLLDNCGAMHLVNAKELLEPGSFKEATSDECVEAGSSYLPILGRGKRRIKNALAGKRGPNTEDLVLSDVAVVDGFHVNIVSEARLRDAGVWYTGFDCSLRFGTEEENVVLKKLERRFNIVFLEYKLLSSCFSFPQNLSIMMFPTIKRRVRQSFRRSKDKLNPRTDSEHVWHARAGHLGPAALEHLVENARNVKINGIKRVNCQHCALAHASQVVSRRTSEHKSPRPFYRISWDLFDFVKGYQGARWLLVIKDEYSGKLFGYAMVSKSGTQIFNILRQFEHWVSRQYALSICKIRHDNDTSIIPINGKSAYQLWAEEEGIEIELTPTYTHESNGGAERAGQEAITRSIKMRLGANLPERLWPETALAGIYLYNKSPSEVHKWKSPNEVLNTWFRNYFRWYDPALVERITNDLRPDWNGIYVYGARAYPLMKEREANKQKRDFKVKPRGHIGYLVGYCASNIYRIWIPQLDKVITTRNVTFDENILYSPEFEKVEGQPLRIIRDIIEVIEESEEIQDAELVFENVESRDLELVQQSEETSNSQESTEPSSEALRSQNSGVTTLEKSGETPAENEGLLTPEPTPEPNRMDKRQSGRDFSAPQELSNQQATAREQEQINYPEKDSSDANRKPTRETRHLEIDTWQRTSQDQAQGQTSSAGRAQESVDKAPEHASNESSAHHGNQEQGATAQPREKRKRRIHGPATRSSKRLQEKSQGSTPDSTNFAFTSRELLSTMLSNHKHWAVPELYTRFFGTFWQSQEEWPNERNPVRTVHETIERSVLKSLALESAPSLPRIHLKNLPKAPKNWRELEKHIVGDYFKADAELELRNLESRNCWRVIERSRVTTKPIPLKWVFTYKPDSAGFLVRCRSRIVVRGDLQDKATILSTYAATLAARSFRTAMAIAAHFDLEVKQFDVINAFINAKREESGEAVICQLPDGFKQPGMCVQVDRALYGMRDAPALWFKEFTSTLEKLELIMCAEEPCMYMDKLRKIFVIFFVDDVQVLYHQDDEKAANSVITGLKGAYELRDLEDVEWFLGIKVIRDRAARKIWLVHDSYIEKITERFKLLPGKCPSTPLPAVELKKHTGKASPASIQEFQEKVGSVLYTAIMLRPDVAFAASQLSHFLTNPGPEHLRAVNWTIQYLYGTRFLAIQYGGCSEAQMIIASDASFADDPETRKSSQGYVFSLFGGLIAWKAARQDTVTTSTTEAELLGVERTGKETIALQRFFREIQLDLGELWNIYCDNQQTIRLIVEENERISTKLRHVDIQNMWLRQEHRKGTFQVSYLPTGDMPADGLTKNLPRQKFEHFRVLLNLQDIRGKVEQLDMKAKIGEHLDN